MGDGLVGVPKIEFYGSATHWKTLKSAGNLTTDWKALKYAGNLRFSDSANHDVYYLS